MEEKRLPEEFAFPPKEDGPSLESSDMPAEILWRTEPALETRAEFEGKSGGKESDNAKNHRLLKRIMLMPVATAIATVSIVFSSFGYDPLGDDFLNQDEGWTQERSGNEGQQGKDGDDKNDHKEKGGSDHLREVKEYPGDIADVIIDVTYVPTGESYRAEALGKEGLAEARKWVKRQGGDPDTISYVKSETVFVGYETSDDAILVGDMDDPENLYVAQGTITKNYKEVAYFNAYESMEIAEQPSADRLEGMPILVRFVPTDETYYPTETGQAGIAEAKEWVVGVGGDPDSMTFVSFRRDTKYEINDGVLSQTLMDFAYYEVYDYADEWLENGGDYDESADAFPLLPNMAPDFDGAYAWANMGSEEYLRIFMSDKSTVYLEAGGYWKNNEGAQETSLSSCWYDAETNTMTMQNFDDPEAVLDANLMGNGFKIRLIGENSIGGIQIWGAMYGGSVTFIGDGSLTVNQNHGSNGTGILLNAEGSESCVMIGMAVTLDIYGQNQIIIYDTQAEQPVIVNDPTTLIGGEIYSGDMTYNEQLSVNLHHCGVQDNDGDSRIQFTQ